MLLRGHKGSIVAAPATSPICKMGPVPDHTTPHHIIARTEKRNSCFVSTFEFAVCDEIMTFHSETPIGRVVNAGVHESMKTWPTLCIRPHGFVL